MDGIFGCSFGILVLGYFVFVLIIYLFWARISGLFIKIYCYWKGYFLNIDVYIFNFGFLGSVLKLDMFFSLGGILVLFFSLYVRI